MAVEAPSKFRTMEQLLPMIQEGNLQSKVNALLIDLIKEVQSTGKKGTLTLQITVAAVPKTESALEIDGKVTVKLPEWDRESLILFGLQDGSLSAHHPKQHDMFAGPRAVIKKSGE